MNKKIAFSNGIQKVRKGFFLLSLIGLTIVNNACDSVLKETTIYEDGRNILTTLRVEQDGYISKAISRARMATTFPIHKYEENMEVASDYLWTLTTPIEHLPEYQTQALILQSLYNLALEEIEANLDDEGLFTESGNQVPLTTYDISIAVMMGLGITHPEASMKALVDRINNGLILQDPQLGGGWPANVDRAAWVIAAWELYLINGNENWLQTAFNISSQTMDQDLAVVYDVEQNLFRGTPPNTNQITGVYPEWMTLSDITETYSLSVNALYYEALKRLSKMAVKLQNGKHARYQILSDELKASINSHFWMENRQYYSSLLYNDAQVQDERSNTLANAWAILFDIADEERGHDIAHNLPVTSLGAPSYYPFQKQIISPANKTIWIIHQAIWNKAIKKAKNYPAYPHGLFSLFRPIAMNMTHRDYFMADTGNPALDPKNRTQSLSAIATTVGTLLQQIFGIEFTEDGLVLNPFVPESLDGENRIVGFKYRDAILNLKLRGYGDQVYAIFIGQRPLKEAIIPPTLKGVHDITVVMTTVEDVTDLGFDESTLEIDSLTYEKIDPLDVLNDRLLEGHYNLLPIRNLPSTPQFLALENESVVWNILNPYDIYHLYRNGEKIVTTQRPRHIISDDPYAAYQLQISTDEGHYSFLSKPLIKMKRDRRQVIEAEDLDNATEVRTDQFGYSGNGYLILEEVANSDLKLKMDVSKKSTYLIRFKYSNGNPITPFSGSASYRAIYLNEFRYESVVLPASKDTKWNEWMYSNPINITVPAGQSTLSLKLEPTSIQNISSKNPIYLDHIEMIDITE